MKRQLVSRAANVICVLCLISFQGFLAMGGVHHFAREFLGG